MVAHRSVSMLILVVLLQLLTISSSRPTDTKAVLMSYYDDGSDMNLQIIKDFLNVFDCPNKCSHFTQKQIKDKFEDYRKEWVENMIDFVIAELDVDQVSARQVKLNPSNFLITYQTFKVLAFK